MKIMRERDSETGRDRERQTLAPKDICARTRTHAHTDATSRDLDAWVGSGSHGFNQT